MSNWGSSKKSTPASRAGSSKGSGSRRGRSRPTKPNATSKAVRHRSRSRGRRQSCGSVRDATPPDEQASRRTTSEHRDARGGRRPGARVPRARADRCSASCSDSPCTSTSPGRWDAASRRCSAGSPGSVATRFRSSSSRSACRSSGAGAPSSPLRLAVGWTHGRGGSSLGLLHVFRGPDDRHDRRRPLERGRRMARRVVGRAPRGAPRPGRRHRGARARRSSAARC